MDASSYVKCSWRRHGHCLVYTWSNSPVDASPRLLGSGGSRLASLAGRCRSPLATSRRSLRSRLALAVRTFGGAPLGRAARSLRASLTARGVAARPSAASLRSAARLTGRFAPRSPIRRRSRWSRRPFAPVLVPLDSRRSSSDVRLASLGSPSPSFPEKPAPCGVPPTIVFPRGH